MSKPSFWVAILVSLFISAIFGTVSSGLSSGRAVDAACEKVEAVFARGSGQDISELGDKTEANRFFDSVKYEVNNWSNLGFHSYELGSDAKYGGYGGYSYPAVAVGGWGPDKLAHSMGAGISNGQSFKYGASVKEGDAELLSYIVQRYSKCKASTHPYFILGGYSQGAQVVGETLSLLPPSIRNRVVYTGLFGDPKLYYPEGEHGFMKTSPACKGQKLSVYRRGPINTGHPGCNLVNGSLGGRIPYLPKDIEHRVGLWCNDQDFVCGSAHFTWFMDGHGEYKDPGQGIDQSAKEAIVQLFARVDNDNLQEAKRELLSSFSQSFYSAPEHVDTSYLFGNGNSPQKDIVYLVDSSWLTGERRESFKYTISQTMPAYLAADGHFMIGVFGNRGIDTNPQSIYPVNPTGFMDYGRWFVDNISFLDNISALDPGFPLANAFGVLSDQVDWRNGANKSIILLTNGGQYQSPDALGFTNEQVARRALEIDPVNIFPVVPVGASEQYTELANLTSGKVETYSDDDLSSALESALGDIDAKPEVYLPNADYFASPGEEVKFDASSSRSTTEITEYAWDFDGDNIFDVTTTTPVATHTYDTAADYIMQVRVTTKDGAMSNASANVHVGTIEAPELPSAPLHLAAKVTETTTHQGTILLTWDKITDPLTDKLALFIDGELVGSLSADRTSIEIRNVSTDADTEFALVGVSAGGEFGESAFATASSLHPLDIAGIIARAKLAATTSHQDYGNSTPPNGQLLSAKSNSSNDSLATSEVLGSTAKTHALSKLDNTNEYLAWIATAITVIIAAGVVGVRRRAMRRR